MPSDVFEVLYNLLRIIVLFFCAFSFYRFFAKPEKLKKSLYVLLLVITAIYTCVSIVLFVRAVMEGGSEVSVFIQLLVVVRIVFPILLAAVALYKMKQYLKQQNQCPHAQENAPQE